MLSSEAFVADLRARGVSFWLEGDRLGLRAPDGIITPEIQSELRERKPAIVALLGRSGAGVVPRIEERAAYAASPAQRRLWTIAQMDGGSAAYHVAVSATLDGALNESALVRAFAALGDRHETLRTTFILGPEGPQQCIHPQAACSLTIEDAAAACDPDAWSHALAQEPFDLERGPLFRAALLRLGPARRILTLVMHHIVADGWSLGILVREVSAFYNAFARGETFEPAPLEIRYRDYSAWQNARAGADLDYWRERLAQPYAERALPVDRARPPVRRFGGELLTFALDAAERRNLEQLASAHRASLFMTLCGLVYVLMQRYTGERDLVLGTPVAGRSRPEFEQQIGVFLNTIVLRTQLDPGTPFGEFLQAVRTAALEAYAHDAASFDDVVNACEPRSDMSRSPLFDVQVVMQNTGSMALALDGIVAAAVPVDVPGSKCDLAFDFDVAGDGLTIGIRYDCALFERERIDRMGRHLRELARSAVADPQVACGRLNLLLPDERAAIIARMNGPEQSLPAETLLDAFRLQAERAPQRVAVRCGSEHVTYRELDERATEFAREVHARTGGRAETAVGVFLERGIGMVAAMLGILKAGCAYVPLDPEYPPARIEQMLRGSKAPLVVADPRTSERLTPIVAQLEHPCEVFVPATQPRSAPGAPLPAVDPKALAYVLFTSGSTGVPKGVEIEHRALYNFLLSMQRTPGISPDDVLLAVTTISFDIAGLELWLPLISGATVVIAPSELARDGEQLTARLDAGDITMMQATPSTWGMLLAAGWKGNARLTVLCGGEALAGALAAQLLPRCAALWNLYGPTETTIWSSVHRAGPADTDAGIVALGHPIHNTRIAVLDDEYRPVPVGVVGDLFIGGSGVARGYRDQPELTAERFISDPFASAPAHLYRTGDRAQVTFDGALIFAGRSDHQLKIRGHRVEAGDVEAAVLRYPGVRETIVCGTDAVPGQVVLCAYVAAEGDLDTAALRAHLERLLPAYMVPSLFVPLAALPRAANGKIDRSALPQPGAPAATDFVAPRTGLETSLAAIWQSVLGVDVLGVNDDFFERGGHSLKATQVVFATQKQLGVRVTIVDVFRNPTVAEFAALVADRHV